MVFLGATKKDEFRKPCTGMYNHFYNNINGGLLVNYNDSFFCGDAAGRPKTASKAKDFSADDLKFAHNVGLKFFTPEELFLGEK